MSVQILPMCALEWLSTLAGNDRAVLLWSPPGAGLAAARALLAVWCYPAMTAVVVRPPSTSSTIPWTNAASSLAR